jgi:membrane protease YdiL (CAAX protease family)
LERLGYTQGCPLIIGLTLALGNLKGMIIASTLFALAHFDLDLMPPFFVSGMLIA